MENESTESADLLRLTAWVEANKKTLIKFVSIAAGIAALVGIYFWYHKHHEAAANDALAMLVENPVRDTTADSAAPYLRVADDYSGTTAAGRALLQAGQILFVSGKFDQAEAQFGRFLRDYSTSPLANQAQVSLAACLEAEGKIDQAMSNYKSLVDHDPTDSNIPQAKSGLARLYLAQKKPEQALQQYEDLMKAQGNDSWTMEAGIQREELIEKYPALVKPRVPPPSMTPPGTTITIPGMTGAVGTNGVPVSNAPPAVNLITPPPAAKSTNP